MNGYVKKVSHTLLLGLVILAIALLVYLVYPKYQIQMVKLSDDTVIITKINTFTGKTETYNPYPKILNTEDLYKKLGL